MNCKIRRIRNILKWKISILDHFKKRELGKGKAKHYSSPLFRVFDKKGGNATDD